jgi:hypothetical protein
MASFLIAQRAWVTGHARWFRRDVCRLDRKPKNTPEPGNNLVQHLEVDLHRLAWKITLEAENPPLLGTKADSFHRRNRKGSVELGRGE